MAVVKELIKMGNMSAYIWILAYFKACLVLFKLILSHLVALLEVLEVLAPWLRITD